MKAKTPIPNKQARTAVQRVLQALDRTIAAGDEARGAREALCRAAKRRKGVARGQ